MTPVGWLRFMEDYKASAEYARDYVNGCDFCGHMDCTGNCCPKCNDPKCYRTYGECPTCTKIADAMPKDAA